LTKIYVLVISYCSDFFISELPVEAKIFQIGKISYSLMEPRRSLSLSSGFEVSKSRNRFNSLKPSRDSLKENKGPFLATRTVG